MSAINSYYQQVLGSGRKRFVILDAQRSDSQCVIRKILAAHFLCSVDSSRALSLIDAAKSCLNHASSYEKDVFDVLLYLISPNREDDLAVELHSKVPVLETPDGEIFESNTSARYGETFRV